MKAQVFHGPGDLRYEELPVPTPGPGEVLVRVEAALTCGTDVKVLRQGHPLMIPTVPTVFGHELAGAVAAVGPGVGTVREGDRVAVANSAPCQACRYCRAGRQNLCDDLLFVNGAYGEYMLVPSRVVLQNLVLLPPHLAAPCAAFAEPLACALHAVEAAAVGPEERVVVFGHGPLGQLLGLLARARGARVVLVGKAGPRLAVARGLGFEACLDVTPGDDPVAALREATGGVGAHHVLEATGQPGVWEQAVAAAVKGGTVVFFGGCAPGTSIRLDTRRVHYEELRLLGVFHHTPALICRALDLLASGGVDPMPLVTHQMDLKDVPEALALMARGEALKVLIHP